MKKIGFYPRVGKRLLDLMLTGTLLFVLLPLFILLAGLVRLRLGSPVLFKQKRPGLNGLTFILVKLRTMRPPEEGKRATEFDNERITSFGTFLRRSSLDEIPELYNVIKGNMSLVGPRPLLMEYLKRYSPAQARIHEVKPGITGWAQINGRNSLNWKQKFDYDVWYVDNLTLWLDLKILFFTLVKTIRQEGISQEGFVSAEEFMGNDS